ncbi:thermonuclease family protein [Candidatus Lucifugimonas marina]|uniref:TNase-like domain-containing protein n=1 Tax=Candidatus Lucifugimonas marina TaxID=3038979 RepID=A0AAJ5ZCZ7_9CHLR|nr:hypothetical protein [SAR202 cluster bacterium JH702]MDG0870895.1 hypothetical protein [SAR202 cluster bacterium JH639]WFG34770.1 hypothetical protein GKN94_03435 [SAR202 cluster bacterium JH545]WFG38710.1 hypothetical protein GKO48_03515 [SAR202 cluster bacterium JH1073]
MRFSTRLLLISLVPLLIACTDSSEVVIDSQVETAVAATVGAQSNAEQQPPSSDGPPQTVIFCPDCQLVSVTGIVDGDTLDTTVGRVRLFGVDTPERGETCFTEATDFTRLLVGNQIRIENGPRLEDSFGRRLAYVYDASGNSIDVQLVAGGLATAWTQDGQHKDVLIGLEESARSNQAGCLWNRLDQGHGGSIDFDPFGPDRDCGDFGTWRESSDFFIAAGGPSSDPHRLDGDNDGVPCESLR